MFDLWPTTVEEYYRSSKRNKRQISSLISIEWPGYNETYFKRPSSFPVLLLWCIAVFIVLVES